MLERRSGLPMWRQLAGILRRQLEAGELGSFPTEQALVVEYGVSRHTVREALRDLRSSGLIERHRGLGTFVVRPPLEQPLRTIYSIAPSVQRYGGDAEHSDVLKQELEVHEAAARALRIDPHEQIAALERLRIVDNEPVMLVQSWYTARIGRALFREDLRTRSVYELLSASLGLKVTGGRERIRASMPTEYERGLLHMPTGEAVLRVERIGLHGEVPIEYRLSVVRGDRFVFIADWPGATEADAARSPTLSSP